MAASIARLFDLSGRVALITGAGSGLGVVFAEALTEAGAITVVADRDQAGVERTADLLRGGGYQSLAVVADVTNEDAVTTMVRRTVNEFGRLDILVNNAGIAAAGPPAELSLDDWRRVVDVNLTGVFLCAREAAKAMIMAGRGAESSTLRRSSARSSTSRAALPSTGRNTASSSTPSAPPTLPRQ